VKIDKELGVISFDDASSDDSLMKDYIDSLQNKMNWGMSFNQYKKWVEKSVLYDPGVIPKNESIH
jgi:hypothetical protein|tara:strand:+ start:688 stop:882 length:195 start_codon:yes stop_codon:yes gene_type:complete